MVYIEEGAWEDENRDSNHADSHESAVYVQREALLLTDFPYLVECSFPPE